MHRLKASAAVLLTAFFAVAGSFHLHALPRPSHDHAGFCSAATDLMSLESCATCKTTRPNVHRIAVVSTADALDKASPRSLMEAIPPSSVNVSFLNGSRAPPTV